MKKPNKYFKYGKMKPDGVARTCNHKAKNKSRAKYFKPPKLKCTKPKNPHTVFYSADDHLFKPKKKIQRTARH